MAEADRRFWLAKAELAEHALAEKKASLITREAAAMVTRQELERVRRRVLEIPGRLAPALAGLPDAAEIEAAIRDEVVGALTELICG